MTRALILLPLFGALLHGCTDGTSGWVISERASTGGVSASLEAGAAGDGGSSLEGGAAGASQAGVAGEGPGQAGATGAARRCPTRFQAFCSPALLVEYKDATSSGELFGEAVPDPETALTCITRDVCNLLFRKTSEIRNLTTVHLVIEDFAGISSTYASGPGESTIRMSSRFLQQVADSGGSVPSEITGILYYHATNMYQSDDGDGVTMAWLVQGVAEYVRYIAGYIPFSQRRPGGKYDDGYTTTGFFLVWLDSQYPDFVYALNQSMSPDDPFAWSPTAFEDITGKDVDQLWADYQASF